MEAPPTGRRSGEKGDIQDMGDQTESSFKVCTMCKKVWHRRSEFLADPAIRAIGYMANFQDLKLGLFCFNHEARGCCTTLVVEAYHFTDLYEGPTFTQRLTGSADCPGYCLQKNELRPCSARCECGYVRAVLDKVTQWKKVGVGLKRGSRGETGMGRGGNSDKRKRGHDRLVSPDGPRRRSAWRGCETGPPQED